MKRVYKKLKAEYQIIANTGETLGLPFTQKREAELVLKDILADEEYLIELCPDSDISKITSLSIVPITNFQNY